MPEIPERLNLSSETENPLPEKLSLSSGPTALGPNDNTINAQPHLSRMGEFSNLDPEGLDHGLMTGMNQEHNRSANHSAADLMGRALVNTATGIVKDIAVGTSYLVDIPQYIDMVKGTEQEFGNWFSKWVEEQYEKDIHSKTKVYRSPDNEGFSPGSGTWWAANAPSVFTAVSLAVPSMALTKGLGATAKLMGGAKLASKLSPAAAQGLQGLSAATFSRIMENTMEAAGAVEETKQYLKENNPELSEEEINIRAGEAGRQTWVMNTAMLAIDTFQFAKMFKMAKNINPSRGLGRAIKDSAPKTWGQIGKGVAWNSVGEGAEEGYQFITNKESQPQSEEGTFAGRLREYFSDGEFWTGVTMGMFGGAAFQGATVMEQREGKPDHEALKVIQQQLKGERDKTLKLGLEKDLAYVQSAVLHAQSGDLDTFEKSLKELSNLTSDEEIAGAGYDPKTFREELSERLLDVKFVEELNNALQFNTKKSPQEKAATMGQLIGTRLLTRKVNKTIAKTKEKINDDIQNGLSPHLAAVKEMKMLHSVDPTEAHKVALDETYNALIASGEFKNKTEIDKALKTPNDDILNQYYTELTAYKKELNAVKEESPIAKKEDITKTTTPKAPTQVEEDMETINGPTKVGDDVIVSTEGKTIRGQIIGLTDSGTQIKTQSGDLLTFDDFTDIKKAKKQSNKPLGGKIVKEAAPKAPPVQTVKEELSEPPAQEKGDIPEGVTPVNLNDLDPEGSPEGDTTKSIPQVKEGTSDPKKLAAENLIHTVVKEFSQDRNGVLNLKDGLPIPMSNDQVDFDFKTLNSPELGLSSPVILTYKQTTYGGKKFDTVLVNVQREGKLVPVTQLKQQGYPEQDWNRIVETVKSRGQVDSMVTMKYTDKSNIVSTVHDNNLRALEANSPEYLPNGKIILGTVKSNNIVASENISFREIKDLDATKGRTVIILTDPVGNNYAHQVKEVKLEEIKYKDKSMASHIWKLAKDFYTSRNLDNKPNLESTDIRAIQQDWNDYRKTNIDPLLVNNKKYGFELGLSKNNTTGLLQFIVTSDKKGEVITDSKAIRAALGNRFFNVQANLLQKNRPYNFDGTQYNSYVDFIVDMGIVSTNLYPQRPFRDSLLTVDTGFVNEVDRPQTTAEEVKTEEKSTKATTRKSRSRRRNDNPDQINFKRTNGMGYTPYTKESLDAELAWAKENIPQLPIHIFKSITDIYKRFGTPAHGAFTQGLVYLAENSEVNTLYHEAFHAVFDNYLPERMKESLLNQYREEGESDIEVEERFAKMFEEYKKGQSKPKGLLAKFFSELMIAIRELFGILRIDDIFQKIDAGSFASALYRGKNRTRFSSGEYAGDIEYDLRVIDALNSPKVRPYNAAKKEGFFNDLKKQGIPQQQIELVESVLEGYDKLSGPEIANLVQASYGFGVKVKTAKENADTFNKIHGFDVSEVDTTTLRLEETDWGDSYLVVDENGNYLSRVEYSKEEGEEIIAGLGVRTTAVYANLTVPGGTNYTENEISTPDITPSIKGHAQFSTDNGIGWFRSDDKQDFKEEDLKRVEDEIGIPRNKFNYQSSEFANGITTKTRRILEVQSDLFQKGRDKDNLIGREQEYYQIIEDEFPGELGLTEQEKEESKIDFKSFKENKFLQLLNKDNNWVTFFIKSIVQDSSRKGYEKILFPTGETAAKVEGHQTLQEFKKQKEDRIKELEQQIKEAPDRFKLIQQSIIEAQERLLKLADKDFQKRVHERAISEAQEKKFDESTLGPKKDELARLKQELADVESGQTQLSSIAKFYEVTVKNILDKVYGRNFVNRITDEYGNEWYEIAIAKKRDESPIKFKLIEGFDVVEQSRRVDNLLSMLLYEIEGALKVSSIAQVNPEQVTPEIVAQAVSKIKLDLMEAYQVVPEDEALAKVVNNLDPLIDRTLTAFSRFGYKVTTTVPEVDESTIEESETPERIYDMNFFESSVKDNVGRRMKLYLATIPRVSNETTPEDVETGKIIYEEDTLGDIDGLQSFYDFNEVYAYLALNLANMNSIDEMLNFMKSMADTKPALYKIIRDLERSNTITEDGGALNNSLRNEFFTTFSKQYVEFLTLLNKIKEDIIPTVPPQHVTSNDYQVINTNNRSLPRTLISKWKENQKFISKDSGKDVFEKFNEYIRKNKAEIDNVDNIGALEPIRKMLKDIGVDVNVETLDLLRSTYYKRNKNGSFSGEIRNTSAPTIGAVLNAYSKGTNIFDGTSEDKGEYSALNRLAGFEASTRVDRTIGSFLNGEGSQVYAVNLNTANSQLIQRLTKPNSQLLKDFLAIPYHKTSKILRDLVDPDSDIRQQFKSYVFDTVSTDRSDRPGTPYDQLNPLQGVSIKFNMFFNGGKKFGYFFPPTPSDKANSTVYRLPKLDKEDSVFFTNDGMLAPTEFKKWIVDTLQDEYDRVVQTINEYDSVPHIQNYHVNKGKLGNAFFFNLYPELNSLLYPEGTPKTIEEASERLSEIDFNSPEVLSMVSEIIGSQLQDEKNKLVERGLLNVKEGKYSLSNEASSYITGNYLAEGRLNQFLTNNIVYTTELTKLLSGDMAYYKGTPLTPEGRIAQLADIDKRAGQSFVPGTNISTTSEVYSDTAKSTFRLAIGSDVYVKSDLYGKTLNVADAQGFITMKRLRDILIGEGKYTKEYRDAWNRVNEGGTNPSDLSIVLQPIKGFHFAHRFDSNLAIPTQVKYSTIPLIKQFTQRPGNEYLDTLRAKMESEGIDEYVFESGIKAGAEQINDSVNFPETFSFITLDNANWRIPQVVPYKGKTEANFGRQIRVLITANLEGIYNTVFGPKSADELKSMYQSLISANLKEGFNKVKARLGNVKDVANTILEEIEKNSARALPDYYYDALAYVEETNNTAFPLSFPLIKRKVENILNGIFRRNATSLKMPGTSAVQVTSLGVGGVVGAKTLKFVQQGDNETLAAEVIVSPQFFLNTLKKKNIPVDGLLDENGQLDINKIPDSLRRMVVYRIPTQGKNSMLPVYIKDFSVAESGSIIYVPYEIVEQSGSDFDIDKLFIETYNFEVDRKTGELRKIEYIPGDDAEAREAQWEHYSKSATRLQKFYNIINNEYRAMLEMNKSQMITLEELVGRSQAEAMFRGFGIINEEYFSEEEIAEILNENTGINYDYFKKLEAKVSELLSKEEFNKLSEAERNSKTQRQNAILDIHYSILTAPQHWLELTTPNGAAGLEKVRAEVNKVYTDKTPRRWNSLWVQEDFRDKNQAGKGLVGASAVVNTGYSFFQDLKVKLSNEYQVLFDGYEGRNLYEQLSKAGNRIADQISELVTAAVDNAKTPIAGDINLNLFTFPSFTLFVTAGAGLDFPTYLINQPIIRDLTNEFVKINASRGSEDSLSDAVTRVAAKYKISPPDTRLEKLTPRNFTTEELKKGMEGDKSINPSEILSTFLYHHRIGENLSRFVNGMSLDSKGNLPTMAENIARLRSLDRAKTSEIILYDQEAYKNHSFQGFEDSVKGSLTVLERYLPDGTPLFTNLINRVSDSFEGADLSAQDVLKVLDDYYTYLFTHKDSFYAGITKDEKLTLIQTGENSLARRIRSYIEKTPDNQLNPFLRELLLEFDKDNSGYDRVSFNNTASKALSQEEKTELSDSIESLYRTGTPEEKAIAIDLFKYSYVIDGFNRSTGSFIDYLPLSLFKEFGLPDFWRGLETTFGFNEAYNEDLFIRQYVQNNYAKLPYVKKYRTMADLLKADSKSKYAVITSGNQLMENRNGYWTPIHKKGGVITEYDMSAPPYGKSILESNNIANIDEQLEKKENDYEVKCPPKK